MAEVRYSPCRLQEANHYNKQEHSGFHLALISLRLTCFGDTLTAAQVDEVSLLLIYLSMLCMYIIIIGIDSYSYFISSLFTWMVYIIVNSNRATFVGLKIGGFIPQLTRFLMLLYCRWGNELWSMIGKLRMQNTILVVVLTGSCENSNWFVWRHIRILGKIVRSTIKSYLIADITAPISE